MRGRLRTLECGDSSPLSFLFLVQTPGHQAPVLYARTATGALVAAVAQTAGRGWSEFEAVPGALREHGYRRALAAVAQTAGRGWGEFEGAPVLYARTATSARRAALAYARVRLEYRHTQPRQ
jgi:hypothetical protein